MRSWLAWILAQQSQNHSFRQPLLRVQIENSGRYSADLCCTFNPSAIELEMIGPAIGSRVKETNEVARFPVDGADVTSLRSVAQSARECQVFRIRQAAVFLADDVVNLASEDSVVLRD